MKKRYIKPRILIEKFSLCTSIAGNCEVKTNTPSEGNCAYQLRTGENIFFSSMGDVCSTHEDDGEYNGLCYHVPNEAKNLFNS